LNRHERFDRLLGNALTVQNPIFELALTRAFRLKYTSAAINLALERTLILQRLGHGAIVGVSHIMDAGLPPCENISIPQLRIR
jgi:hypothetical protein